MEPTDETYFKMFAKWPCNSFKPRSHVAAKWNEMRVNGTGACNGYRGVVEPPKNNGEWVVFLSCGAPWAYRSLAEMLADWRIAR